MQVDEKHRKQHQLIFQEAEWGSRLRMEREGIEDGRGA